MTPDRAADATVGLAVVALVGRGLLWVDTWVHSRANNESAIVKDIADIKTRFDDGNTRLSAKMSELQKKIGDSELRYARLEERLAATDKQVQGVVRHLQKITNGA